MSGSQLISVTELNALLSDPKLVLLDVRYSLTDAAYGRAAYAEGHIPGARFADLKADVAGVCSGSNGRTPLPDSPRGNIRQRPFPTRCRPTAQNTPEELDRYDYH